MALPLDVSPTAAATATATATIACIATTTTASSPTVSPTATATATTASSTTTASPTNTTSSSTDATITTASSIDATTNADAADAASDPVPPEEDKSSVFKDCDGISYPQFHVTVGRALLTGDVDALQSSREDMQVKNWKWTRWCLPALPTKFCGDIPWTGHPRDALALSAARGHLSLLKAWAAVWGPETLPSTHLMAVAQQHAHVVAWLAEHAPPEREWYRALVRGDLDTLLASKRWAWQDAHFATTLAPPGWEQDLDETLPSRHATYVDVVSVMVQYGHLHLLQSVYERCGTLPPTVGRLAVFHGQRPILKWLNDLVATAQPLWHNWKYDLVNHLSQMALRYRDAATLEYVLTLPALEPPCSFGPLNDEDHVHFEATQWCSWSRLWEDAFSQQNLALLDVLAQHALRCRAPSDRGWTDKHPWGTIGAWLSRGHWTYDPTNDQPVQMHSWHDVTALWWIDHGLSTWGLSGNLLCRLKRWDLAREVHQRVRTGRLKAVPWLGPEDHYGHACCPRRNELQAAWEQQDGEDFDRLSREVQAAQAAQATTTSV